MFTRRLVALTLFLLLALPATTYAHHGMWDVGDPGCGTHESHQELEMTKGRTDGMVYRVDHTVGCKRLIYSNLAPAGIGESQGNAWQLRYCQTEGKRDAVSLFDNYFHVTVSPDDITVTCSPWKGGD